MRSTCPAMTLGRHGRRLPRLLFAPPMIEKMAGTGLRFQIYEDTGPDLAGNGGEISLFFALKRRFFKKMRKINLILDRTPMRY
jgi:hypothetical protein